MATPGLAQAPAQPAPSGPIYVIGYFETVAGSAPATAAALRQFAAATHKEDGNLEFLALHEIGRPGRFAYFEGWRDKAALDAHAKATDALRARLQKQLAAPFDIRPCVGLDMSAAAGAAAAHSAYVLTHVDVVPSFKDQTIGLVKQLAADSRKDPGAVRFDAVQQGNRPNHMFLIETWRDHAAFDGHVAAEHTRGFREKLLPMQGALYDERLYEAIR